jgi:hypothetical protein
MEAFVPYGRYDRTEAFESELSRVFGVRKIGRDINAPVRERCTYGFEPFPMPASPV